MIPTEFDGIRNYHRVDNHLLRGGDINAEGIRMLARLRVERIISLKNILEDIPDEMTEERQLASLAGIEYTNIPMCGSGIFSYDDGSKVPSILKLIHETSGQVLVHCHHGSDRTGVVVACYRIVNYGYSAEEALKEMKQYGNAWIHFGMRAFVKEFAKKTAAGRLYRTS